MSKVGVCLAEVWGCDAVCSAVGVKNPGCCGSCHYDADDGCDMCSVWDDADNERDVCCSVAFACRAPDASPPARGDAKP